MIATNPMELLKQIDQKITELIELRKQIDPRPYAVAEVIEDRT